MIKKIPEKYLPLIIFSIAFLVRMVFLVTYAPERIDIPAGGDSIGYDQMALNIIQHHEFSFTPGKPSASREPLYPLFLAGIYTIFGHSYLAVRIIQILISSFTCVMIYYLAKLLFNISPTGYSATGLIASIISCFYPYLVYYSTTFLRGTLFTFFLILTIYVLTRNIHNKKLSFLSGFLLGLCALINTSTLVFILATGVFFLFSWSKKDSLKYGAIMFLGFFLVYSFWVIRNYRVYNTLILGSTVGGMTFYGALAGPYEIFGTPEEEKFWKNDDVWQKAIKMDELSANRFFFKEGLKIIKENPLNFLNKLIKKFIKLWRLYPHRGKGYVHSETLLILASLFSYGLILPFAIYGAITQLKRWKEIVFLYLPIVCFTAVYTLIWAVIRYRLPLEPYIIIFGSYTINLILQKVIANKMSLRVMKTK